jgi:hypothetical protein
VHLLLLLHLSARTKPQEPEAPIYDIPDPWKRLSHADRIELLRNHLMDAIYDAAPEGVGYFEVTITERKGQGPIIARGLNGNSSLFLYRPDRFEGWHEVTPMITRH